MKDERGRFMKSVDAIPTELSDMSVSHDMLLYLERTNHCLVCKVPVNLYTRHKNLHDIVEVAGGRTVRSCLEQVLEVSLATSVAIWLCGKCYMDLEQIQVYYNLVKHFRDRFLNTLQPADEAARSTAASSGIHQGNYSGPPAEIRAPSHSEGYYTSSNVLLHTSQQNANSLIGLSGTTGSEANNCSSLVGQSHQSYSKYQYHEGHPSTRKQPPQLPASFTRQTSGEEQELQQPQQQYQQYSDQHNPPTPAVLERCAQNSHPKRFADVPKFLENFLDLQEIPNVHIKKEEDESVTDAGFENSRETGEDTLEESLDSHEELRQRQKSLDLGTQHGGFSKTGNSVRIKGSQRLNKNNKHRHRRDSRTTANTNDHRCTLCNQGFKSEVRLRRHMLTHRRSGPFKCSVCMDGFSSEKQLQLHMQTHAEVSGGQASKESNVNGPPLPTGPVVVKEEVTEEEEEEEEEASKQGGMGVETEKEEDSEDATVTPPKADGLTCRLCPQSFADAKALRMHKRSHTTTKYAQDGRLQCPDCGEQVADSEKLKEHMREKACSWPWKCHLCEAGFVREVPLKKHLRAHARDKRATCPICHKRLADAGYMKEHIRTHTGEQPFACTICDKRFNNPTNLKSHERIHTGEKPYKCRVCGETFGQHGQKKVHELRHSDEAPHVCPTCGKGFFWACSFKKHLQTHTDEKPELCSICGKSFRNLPALHAHARSHSDHRPHVCSFCGKGFKTAKHLSVHKRIHTGEKPFTCEHCGRSFTQGTGLKFHLRTHNVTSR